MKKLLTILLLILIFFTSFGHYFLYQYISKRIKSEIKSFIKHNYESELYETIKYSKNGEAGDKPKFIDKKEFIYKNKLYDIVRKTESGDSIVIVCINDVKEEQLISEFIKHDSPYGKDNNKYNLIKELKEFYSLYLLSNVKELVFLESVITGKSVYGDKTISNYSQPEKPPPKFIS